MATATGYRRRQDTLVDVCATAGPHRPSAAGAQRGVCAIQGEDGRAVLSCGTGDRVDGRSLTTIEGVATPAGLHPVQQAFLEFGAVQCGACTPG
jgi:aerobic-type carbon monoxide dehydrogenase small subunit (CoxS/CutS family)